MAVPIPSAYGVRITSVERLSHPKSLTWAKVTWVTAAGAERTAKTVPGGTVNRQIAALPLGVEVDIITNGRSQVLFVRPVEDEED